LRRRARLSRLSGALSCGGAALTTCADPRLGRSGVDVSPIVWVALTSFMNEILVGKQGLLVLLAQKVA